MAQVTLHGSPMNTNGDLPTVGSAAPDFRLVDGELNDVGLADFAGIMKPGVEIWKHVITVFPGHPV